jgi:tetratricopeptide (TPR) repeat protein
MRFVVAGLLVGLLLSAARPLAGQDLPAPLADKFSSGVAALKAGALDDAEAAFREVLHSGGDRSFVHYNLGIVLQTRGRHEEAVTEFRTALRLDPSFALAHLLAGSSLLALNRISDATTELRLAAKAMPTERAVHLSLADAYERAHNYGALVDEFRRLQALEPGNPDYSYRLGKAYLKLAQWSFERIRSIDPDAARLQQALGLQYLDQNRPDFARNALERAATRDPTLDEVHLALARLHLEQGDLEQARVEVERELAIAPSSAAALELKAEIEKSATHH